MLELKTLEELISLGKGMVGDDSVSELYLTECDNCCSNGASYRLFTDLPRFTRPWGSPHPDTGPNEDRMAAKTYFQKIGEIDKIAELISPGTGNAGEDRAHFEEMYEARDMDLPINATIRKLK